MVQRDKNIPGTTVRSTTISEELGRIQDLRSDKTGTLTQNEMVRPFGYVPEVPKKAESQNGRESTNKKKPSIPPNFMIGRLAVVLGSGRFESCLSGMMPYFRLPFSLFFLALPLSVKHNIRGHHEFD